MLREKLLEIFETNKGDVISGSVLAKQLNVSRNAVWKAVEVLRLNGYDIVSVKKSGYMLVENSDVLSEFKIRNSLGAPLKNTELNIFKCIDSTSMYINRRAVDNAPEWCTAACEEQTNAKLRNLSKFFSPAGKGVYMSVLLKPNCAAERLAEFPRIAAVSVMQAIKNLTGIDTTVKNVADLYCGEKKICGILSDASVECATSNVRHVCIGIGVRVYSHTEAEKTETSIYDITGKYCNRSELIAEILNCMYKNYSTLTKTFERTTLNESIF